MPGPGWHTFEINNQSTGGGEIDLIDPANGAVYAEVENTGPGTVTPMRLNLGSGTYAFLCNFTDFNPQVGAKVTVGGHAKGTPAILPVSYNETIPYAKKYQAYTEAGLKVLARETAALRTHEICTSVAVTVGSTNDRCGYSQRLPFVVISPYTGENYVSGNEINTASVVKFIEDNWLRGERIPNSFDATSSSLDARGGVLDFDVKPHFTPLILNPTTGAVVSGSKW